jgi:FSR family fosmidomycin resistance protein-like MFS transporter
MILIHMSRETQETTWKRTGLLFLGHLLNDGYGSFFAPLLPLLIERLDLSLAMAGMLGTARILVNSLAQPGLGLLVDRVQRPFLVVVGPLLTVCAMSLIGRVGNFEQLAVLMVIAGLGTALFHPAAASLVAAGGGNNRGLVMAFFSAGGTLGGALAPLLIVTFVGTAGLTNTPWLVAPGLLILVLFTLPLRHTLPPTSGKKKQEKMRFRTIPRPLVLLWSVIVLRSMATTSFSSFLAVLITARGASAFSGGAAISVFLFSGALGGFLAGNLSDRFGRKVVIFTTLILATPFLLLFLYGPPNLSLLFVVAAGLCIFASTPVGVVAAQELLPGKTGLVSGLVMGLAWGVGGLALTPVGWLADRFGLVSVMTGVALLPLLAGGLTLFYHDGQA